VKTRVFMLAAAIALCAPAAANAATVPVQQLNGVFEAGNSTVTKTPDGVHFGTYADSGCPNPAENCIGHGGTLTYHGADRLTLSQITSLGYTFNYRSADEPGLLSAAPYLRLFFDDGTDVVFDPSRCAQNDVDQATDVPVDVVHDTVRFNDDGCDSLANQQPWAAVVAAHGDEVISGIGITQGFTLGHDTSALVRNLTVNGTTFAFDVAPVGTPGPAGPAGTTTVVRVPVAVPTTVPGAGVLGTQATSCKGDDLLTLHAARRAGQRFLSAKATLRGKGLTVKGRSIRLDLRGRSEGNYDVRIVARYRTKSGRVVRVVTHRVRSVAC
jgi:hypothetical protein